MSTTHMQGKADAHFIFSHYIVFFLCDAVVFLQNFAPMNFENDLIAFEEMLHRHGYRVESRTARSFFEQADGNVKLAFDRFVASLSPAPQPVPEWVQLVDPSGRTYYQNNHTQQVQIQPSSHRCPQTFIFPPSTDPMGSSSRLVQRSCSSPPCHSL